MTEDILTDPEHAESKAMFTAGVLIGAASGLFEEYMHQVYEESVDRDQASLRRSGREIARAPLGYDVAVRATSNLGLNDYDGTKYYLEMGVGAAVGHLVVTGTADKLSEGYREVADFLDGKE